MFLAKICSIHFSSNSFVTEYKIWDHLGCYTNVLKYDAVPTLHLPVSQPFIIINPVQISSQNLEANTSPNLPSISYENGFTADLTNNTSLHAESYSARKIHKSSKDDHELDQIKQENLQLQTKINKLKSDKDSLKSTLTKIESKYRDIQREYDSIRSKHCFLQVSMMTVQQQKNLLAKVFSESQTKILSGKKKIYWSSDDMAIGYTIRNLSNKRCYAYLTKNLNIPLPALSSIKRWATIKKNKEEKLQESI